MKHIFKFTIALIIFSGFGTIQAQTYKLELGYMQPIRYSNEMSHRYFYGTRIGGVAEFQLPISFLSVETGLSGSFAWSKDTQKGLKFYTDSTQFKTKGIYLDIPIRLQASYYPHKEIKLFCFVGPNLNIGLYQPQNTTMKISNDVIVDQLNALDIKAGKRDLHQGDLRRFNIQIEAGGGIQWRKYILRGGYAQGLNDLSRKKEDVQRQSGWFVNAAYEF